jgi:hypothetical protein
MRGCWCGPNCGERYWGDFYSDPPDCWDPCDCHGNYTGGGCSSCGGGTHDGGGYHESGGCRNCGRSGGVTHSNVSSGMDDGPDMSDGKIISQDDRVVSPAQQSTGEPHKAVRQ